jgi:hypothetical protein
MTPNNVLSKRLINGDLSVIFYFSVLKLLLHLALNISGGYGFFRDEFYYIACSENLAAGYVDQPPLCALLLRALTSIFGDSLFVVRLIPAIAGSLSVFLTGLITMRLGGGRLATFIACMLSFSPIYLAMSSFYSMNSLDILFWILSAYVIIRIVQEENKKLWIALGLVLGFGLMNKVGILFLGAGIFAGLLATRERKWFFTSSPYVAAGIAVTMFLPYIVWNVQNDFAHLEFIHNASTQKYSTQSASGFLTGQLLQNNPVALLVWLPGLVALFTASYFRPYRILAWMYVVPLLIFLANGTSKPEYLAPAYAMLFAAGGVFWENHIRRAQAWRYVVATILILWVLLAVVVVPLVLPVLPVQQYVRYANSLGFKPPSSEGKEQSELPQFYADMFGWKEKVAAVAAVYNKLTPEEKKLCAIFATNYGRCASIDYYSEEYGLPKTIGDHNNYWIWGPRGYTGEIVIILGGDIEDLKPNFREVTIESVADCQYCMPYEDNLPVFLCRGLKGNLKDVWAQEKHFE